MQKKKTTTTTTAIKQKPNGHYLAIESTFSYFVNSENTFAVQRYTLIDVNGDIDGKLAVVISCVNA